MDGALSGDSGDFCSLLNQPLRGALHANWLFKSLIMGVLLVGIGITARQVLVLEREMNWIRMLPTGRTGISLTDEPRFLRVEFQRNRRIEIKPTDR